MINTLSLVIYVLGVGVFATLDILATMMGFQKVTVTSIMRSILIVLMWPTFVVCLIIARIVFKLKNPYHVDEDNE